MEEVGHCHRHRPRHRRARRLGDRRREGPGSVAERNHHGARCRDGHQGPGAVRVDPSEYDQDDRREENQMDVGREEAGHRVDGVHAVEM